MKKIIPKIKYFLLVFAVIFAASCSPEDGADGADGATGPAGPAGPAGQNGVDGNANVISVSFQDFALVLGQNEISVPQLTAAIVNKGIVIGYVAGQTANQWFTLPLATFTQVEVPVYDETTGAYTGTEVDLASTTLIEITAVEIGKVYLTSLIQGTIDLRFTLVESSTP